ncbi:MAG: hypothetical protein IT486_10580 [Gammaproteobacteria bacterium]|nr:hypothetical protein [Gammaproteobacteria bacterium]
MARLFYGSVLGGVLLSVLVAGVFPLPHSQRYRSTIEVVPDGGREETFVIEWPADRIQPLRDGGAGSVHPAGLVAVVDGPAGVVAAAEVFRLRDVAGNVVGLASRTATPADPGDRGRGTRSEWMLLLPSRGALFLSQIDALDTLPRAVTGPMPVPVVDTPGFWAGGERRRITTGPADGGAGRVGGGTAEFAGLQGSYDETWERRESAAGGVNHGRIVLRTRVLAGP